MPNKARWKRRSILIVVLIISLVGIVLFVGRMSQRTELTSASITGHRCRFTISSEWQSTRDSLMLPGGWAEAYTIIPTPSPIREWIAVHLLQQAPVSGSNSSISIRLETYAAENMKSMFKFVSGYPEPNWQVMGIETVRGEEHFLIDGCPATSRRYEVAIAGMTIRGWILLVSTPDHSAGFTVYGIADRRYSDQSDREMQAIISSFHVDNVGVGKGVRR